MEPTRWWTYVERLMDAAGWSKADLSRAADIDQSVIGRWQSKRAAPVASNVRAVAQAFGRDVREAAIAAEMFTAEELMGDGEPIIDPETFDLSVIPNKRLRDEVYDRMEHGHGSRPRTPRPRSPRRNGAAVPGPTSVAPAGGRDVTEVGRQQLPPAVDGAARDSETEGETSSQG